MLVSEIIRFYSFNLLLLYLKLAVCVPVRLSKSKEFKLHKNEIFPFPLPHKIRLCAPYEFGYKKKIWIKLFSFYCKNLKYFIFCNSQKLTTSNNKNN